MAGRSISGYVDDKVANRLFEVARAEARSPASLVGQALGFYVSLPEAARTSLRRLEINASTDEMRWFQTEFVRLIFKADMALTQRNMADEMAGYIPEVDGELEIERVSDEWTNGVGR